jgi:hypothetical protein
MLAAAFGTWLLGAILPRLAVPGIDTLLRWAPFAIAFTIFAVGGSPTRSTSSTGTTAWRRVTRSSCSPPWLEGDAVAHHGVTPFLRRLYITF